MPKEIKNTFTYREPVALIWLPTMTIKDYINQKNVSTFNLRKKKKIKLIANNEIVEKKSSMQPLSPTTIVPVTSIQAIINHLDENESNCKYNFFIIVGNFNTKIFFNLLKHVL